MRCGLMLIGVGRTASWPSLVSHFATEQLIAVVTDLELPQSEGFYFERVDPAPAEQVIGAHSIAQGWHGVVQHEGYALSLTTATSAAWTDNLSGPLRRWLQQQTLANAQLSPELMHWIRERPQWHEIGRAHGCTPV